MQSSVIEQFLSCLLLFPDACRNLTIQINESNSNSSIVDLQIDTEGVYTVENEHRIEITDQIARDLVKYGLSRTYKPVISYQVEFDEERKFLPLFIGKVIFLTETVGVKQYRCQVVPLFPLVRLSNHEKPIIFERPKLVRQVGYYKSEIMRA